MFKFSGHILHCEHRPEFLYFLVIYGSVVVSVKKVCGKLIGSILK